MHAMWYRLCTGTCGGNSGHLTQTLFKNKHFCLKQVLVTSDKPARVSLNLNSIRPKESDPLPSGLHPKPLLEDIWTCTAWLPLEESTRQHWGEKHQEHVIVFTNHIHLTNVSFCHSSEDRGSDEELITQKFKPVFTIKWKQKPQRAVYYI